MFQVVYIGDEITHASFIIFIIYKYRMSSSGHERFAYGAVQKKYVSGL